MNKRLTISVAATSSLTPEVSSVGTESSWKRRRVSSSQGYQRTVVSARIYVLLTSIGQFATPSACRRESGADFQLADVVEPLSANVIRNISVLLSLKYKLRSRQTPCPDSINNTQTSDHDHAF